MTFWPQTSHLWHFGLKQASYDNLALGSLVRGTLVKYMFVKKYKTRFKLSNDFKMIQQLY